MAGWDPDFGLEGDWETPKWYHSEWLWTGVTVAVIVAVVGAILFARA